MFFKTVGTLSTDEPLQTFFANSDVGAVRPAAEASGDGVFKIKPLRQPEHHDSHPGIAKLYLVRSQVRLTMSL